MIRAASIVVGVDGSPESLTAAEWAAAEAAATDASLVVCHVVPVLAPDAPEPGPGAQIAHRTAERARAAAPRLPVEELILAGATSAELLVEAAEARLLVVGKARTDRRAGTRSVGEQLAAYLTAPMVVVPGAGGLPLPSDAPVTVGVDRSAAEATLGFAFEYASRHRRPVAALHAYRPAPGAVVAAAAWRSSPWRAADLLQDAVRPWAAKFPEVHVDLLPTDAEAPTALIEESVHSALLVVGAPGGGAPDALPGSVSRQLLRHAHCPIAFVPG